MSNNSSRVTHAYNNHGGNKDTKCVLHPDGNHTTAECNKLRNLKGTDKGKGKRTDKKNHRHQIKPYHGPAYSQNNKGKGTGRRQGGKGKGKQPFMGSRTPRTDITCDHCQKKGHVARDCFTRQNDRPKVLTQAVTTSSPLVVEFQQYVTDVKRKATSNLAEADDETNEPNNESNTVSQDDSQDESSTKLSPEHSYILHEWGTNVPSQVVFEPAWGNAPTADNKDVDTSWKTVNTPPPPDNYSPEKNPHRSGSCQYCDVSLRSRKMTGSLTCTECRHLMAYDKQLEDENLRDKGTQEGRIQRHNTQNSVSALLLVEHDQRQQGENKVTQTGESENTPIAAEETTTGEQEHETQTHSPRQQQLMTYLSTKDRLQALFRSWRENERHEKDGFIKPPLSFTIPLSPNPFNHLRDETNESPEWEVTSSPWTHHLLQFQKTTLRMRYKRMTKARVKLMHAIGREQRLSPISFEKRKKIATTRLKITGEDVHNNPTLEQTRENKIHLRQHATHTITAAPRTQPHRPTYNISRRSALVSEGTNELCLYHHNVQAQHFFQRYNPTTRVTDLTALPHILTI